MKSRLMQRAPKFFNSVIMALECHWAKCILLEGHYLEIKKGDCKQTKVCWLLTDFLGNLFIKSYVV